MGEKIYNGMGAIVGFLFSILLFQTVFGEKTAERYTVLLLIIILLHNSGKLETFLQSLFKNSKTTKTS